MFRIAKLNNVSNEKVTINLGTIVKCGYENGKKSKE